MSERPSPPRIPPARPAATVAVLRDGPRGLEVLMVKRSGRSAFMADAHVFPGGRVDPADARTPVVGGQADRLRMGIPDAAAYQVAAVRETYEEANVLLARGRPDPEARRLLQSGRASFAEVAAARGWVVDADRLVYWAHWVTPEQESRRYDTRFFIADVTGQEVAAEVDRHEVVSGGWWTPAEVLQACDAGEVFLAPPTFCTLLELRDHATVSGAMAWGRTRRTPRIQPVLEQGPEGIAIVLPEEADGPRRLTLRAGRWWVHR